MRGFEDAVLRPESGENWNTAQRQHADGVGDKSQRHVGAKTTHAANVLLFVAAVYHRARAEKKQRLEERMRDQVEHADSDAADTEAGHHVAELRNRGVGENALDIVLRDRDERSENR